MSCLSFFTSVNFSRSMFTAKMFWMTWFILDSYSCKFTLAMWYAIEKEIRSFIIFEFGANVRFWKGFSDELIYNSIRTK